MAERFNIQVHLPNQEGLSPGSAGITSSIKGEEQGSHAAGSQPSTQGSDFFLFFLALFPLRSKPSLLHRPLTGCWPALTVTALKGLVWAIGISGVCAPTGRELDPLFRFTTCTAFFFLSFHL